MENLPGFKLSQEVVDWLLDSDPALEWQVRKELLCEPAKDYEDVRRRVPDEGWGKQVLDAQMSDGSWNGVVWKRGLNSTYHALTLLYLLGIDPQDSKALAAVKKVRENVCWTEDVRYACN